MKKFTILIAFALIFGAVQAQLPDNWTGDSGIDLFQESTTVHGGTYSCGVIVNTGIQGNCDLTNEVAIEVADGDDYHVSFWAYTSEFNRATVVLDWVGASSTYSGTYVGPATVGWEQLTYDGIVPSGATAVNIRIRFYDVSGFTPPETQYIDDVEFESPVGEPVVVTNGDFESWPGINPEPSNHPTNFTAEAVGLNIALTWTDAVGAQLPDAYLIKASGEDNITAPVDGVFEVDDLDLSDGSGVANVAFGVETFTFTNLEGSTPYYFKIYPYTNSGTNIDYKTDGAVPSADATTSSIIVLNSEDFDAGWGEWTTVNVLGDQVWDRDNTYGIGGSPCAKMSGYAGGDFANEDWLISPSFNFDSYDNELLTFWSAMGYPMLEHQLTAKISTDYDGGGDPSTGTWTDLSATMASGDPNWQWTYSGEVDVSGFNSAAVYIAFVYLSDGTDSETWEVDDITITGEGGAQIVATPVFDPLPGNYVDPIAVEITCSTPEAEIFYTTDGSDPDEDSEEYTDPIAISATTTLKARAYLDEYAPSSIASGEYLFPADVATIAELRAGTLGNMYNLTGEVVQTYKQSWRNQRFVQDATAAIIIDDNDGIITTDYNNGDGITGILGTLGDHNNMLQFVPYQDPGPATGGFVITPEVITIAQMNANFEDYEAELVKIESATFANGGSNFNAGAVYPITDISDADGNFRTSFYDADYLDTAIPAVPTDITGICNSTYSGEYITSRFLSDFEPTVVVPTIVVTSPNGYEQWQQGSIHDITWANIDFTGNVNIRLQRPPITNVLLAGDIANTGSWEWNIPENQVVAGNYKIEVKGVNPGDPSDESNDDFAIVPAQQVPIIVINEIMYNPSYDSLGSDGDFEYLELYNNSGFNVDLSGWTLAQAITYTFEEGAILADGEYLVVAIKPDSIMSHYGITNVVGPFGGGLNNSGEPVELKASDGTQMDIVSYEDGAPWPSAPDGDGPSLELIGPNLDNALPESWAASLVSNGTPGAQNSVVGAEILTLTSPNGGETFEQGGSEEITWTYLGFTGLIKIELITEIRGREVLAENVAVTDGIWDWEIPGGQTVGDNYLIAISDMDDGEPSDESDAVFSIVAQIIPVITVVSPNGGEEWTQGTTQIIDWSQEFFEGDIKIEVTDGATPTTIIESVSVLSGSYSWDIPSGFPLGTNYTVIISEVLSGTPSDESDAPFSIIEPAPLPDIVINEIMYNSPGYDNEWMEIYNRGTETVDLEGYYILDDDDAHVPVIFPAGYSIAPDQYFTVSLEISTPPLFFTPDFEGNALWSLGNSADNLRFFHSSGQLVDSVSYTDDPPWPTEPDGDGPSLSLLSPELDNDLGENWAASLQNDGTPGAVNFPTVASINVMTPNGGEEIQQGTTFNITWTYSNYDGNVIIELTEPAKIGSSIVLDTVPVADETFAWDVAQETGTNYVIKISDELTGEPVDESDAVFSIIPPLELPDIVINEIMYNPPEAGTDTLEYIELYNNDVMSVNLENWSFTEGVEFIFPNYELLPGEYLVVSYDTTAMLNIFGVTSLQWASGGLKNSGEDIELRNATDEVIDYVNYDDANGWNKAADGWGPSLTLIDPSMDNNVPESWYVETFFAGLNAEMIGIYGTPGSLNNPAAAQGILMYEGWGGVSAYAVPADPTLETVIDKVADSIFMMQHFSQLYLPTYSINTIVNWNNDLGYQIKMISTRYLVVDGDMVADKSVDLTEGWNILPVLSECAVNASDLFSGVAEVVFVKDLSSDLIYWSDGGIFTLEYLLPGRAYFIKVSADITLVFPECITRSVPQIMQKQANPTLWDDVVPTGNSHAIGFSASAISMLREGDVIGAFTSNGVCAGMAIVSPENASMLVWGDDIYTLQQDGFAENESLKFKVFRPATGEQFEVEAVYDQSFADAGQFAINGISFVTDLKAGSTGFGEYNEISVRIYPNPAKEVLNIELSDFRATTVEIYSSLGQRVYTGEVAGTQAQININTLQKGIYFLKVYDEISGKHETLSFIKE